MVLEAMHHARLVVEALGYATDAIDAQYEELRDSLFCAVRSAHVKRDQFDAPTFDAIATVVQGHEAVYTTNYDLCSYWSRLDAEKRLKICAMSKTSSGPVRTGRSIHAMWMFETA